MSVPEPQDKPAPAAGRQWRVPLSDVLVDDAIRNAVDEVLRSGWWSMGPTVAELEAAFAEFSGAKHAIAVANGTAALHLALAAAREEPPGEVIVPSLTFVAAANTVSHAGGRVVLCDVIGEHDLNLDPSDVEAAIGPETTTIMALHYGGNPCDLRALIDIADRHGLTLIEDAAHAPGAMWQGRMCGTVGAVGCFSFFANKNLPTGEGGMVVTDDDAIAARVRLLRSHGMTTLTWERHRGHAHSYDVVARGLNYRLDELRAAIALVQLDRLPEMNDRRARIVERYRKLLHGVHGMTMPFASLPEGATSAHHLAVVLVPQDTVRDDVRDRLATRGIQTSVHYPPIHRFTAYAEDAKRPLPVTDAVAGRLLTLPLYGHLADEEVDYVAAELLQAIDDAPAISANGSSGSR